eukprot:g23998.t1
MWIDRIGGISPQDVRQVQFGLGESTGQRKRGAEDDPAAVAAKRTLSEEKLKEQIDIRKGNRCWAHCLVRFTDRDGSLRAKKSDKPELGMIVKEEEGGYVQIQFESKEHETERLEMMKKKRYGRIKGWLRYPRFFEGQIQKVDPKWIQKTRPPPRLCSCPNCALRGELQRAVGRAEQSLSPSAGRFLVSPRVMSAPVGQLAVDEYGNPFIILEEQAKKKRLSGLDAHKANILAAKAVADSVRSSMGPRGMDKMVVGPDGD